MLNTFYLKMFDSYIEQAENSARVTLAMMQDMQSAYVAGMRMVLKAEQSLEKRSKFKLPLIREAVDFFEVAAPAIMKAQHDLATASFNVSLDMAKSIRENLTTNASAENDGEHA
jgi:hypothetical protein